MDQLTNLTAWDVKDVFNKVKNVVMNYTEMESKVREATNNEPWGASSTLMQEIAQGTYNYQYFNEIMPTIYKRFTEKEARQWRQIYKALQLLEYLVKHGSERVVDDARDHMATVKILRNFSYIDEKGKDQGINVRNRAKELADMLSDIDKIRAERKKAKATRNKYTGVSSETLGYSGGGGGGSYGSGSSRYGGFGNDSPFNSYRVGYNDDSSKKSKSKSGRSRYDDFDDDWDNEKGSHSSKDRKTSSPKSEVDDAKNESSHAKNGSSSKNEVNLFDFDDEPSIQTTSTTNQQHNQSLDDEWGNLQSATSDNTLDDDFAEFQSAPAFSAHARTGSQSTFATHSAKSSITGIQFSNPVSQPNNGTGVTSNTNMSTTGNSSLLDFDLFSTPAMSTTTTQSSINLQSPLASQPSSKPANQTSSFSAIKSNDIWSQASSLVSLDSLGSKQETKPSVGPSMNSLAQANSHAWTAQGTWTGMQQNQMGSINNQTKKNTGGDFDLLL